MSPTNTWIAEQELSSKRALIYALGGGHGHIQRASLLAQQFSSATILHQNRSPFSPNVPVLYPQGKPLEEWVGKTLKECASSHDCVIVDTFPKGIAHEITKDVLQEYESSVLIARYLREEMYLDYETACAWYKHIWLPYHPQRCEWSHPPQGAYLGTIVREITINDDQTDLCVIGNQALIPERWLSLFPEKTIFIHHRFHALPHAQRYLCVGAGYNLFWELHFLGHAVAHVPIEKRYDDQFRRCLRFGRSISTYQELCAFLSTEEHVLHQPQSQSIKDVP